MTDLQSLFLSNRSYRRFQQQPRIALSQCKTWINLARISASAKNDQVLRYIISVDPKSNSKIFPNCRWAGALKDWDGPSLSEQPTAYIIILSPMGAGRLSFYDTGIAAQSILLGAVSEGFGGCMIRSFVSDALMSELDISDEYEIQLVIALGKPSETVVIEDVSSKDSLTYYRTSDETHHVPKLNLSELIIKEYN